MKSLGHDADGLTLGQRDAVHVPIVVARVHDSVPYRERPGPGDWVVFTDETYRFIEKAPSRKEALGMIDPFLEDCSFYENVVVLLVPGITTPVRHEFEINPQLREIKREILEEELERAKQEDPECAGCWAIRNGKIIWY